MAEYYDISREEMAAHLEGQGFKQYPAGALGKVKELVWAKRLDVQGNVVVMRVYSGINPDGRSRAVGEDAIRVQLFYQHEGRVVSIGGSKRVHRVKGWKTNLQSRIDGWADQLGPCCPKCGKPMVLRSPKPKQTWKPFYSCIAWNRDNSGCDGTMAAWRRAS